MAINFMI